jgi:hypothetical protein
LLFGISSIGRCLALLLLKGLSSTGAPACAIGIRTVGVRPTDASIGAPILPSLPDQAYDLPEEIPLMPERGDERQGTLSAFAKDGQLDPRSALTERGRDSGQAPPGQSVRSPRATPSPGPSNALFTSSSNDLPEQRQPRAGVASANVNSQE